MFLLYVLFWCHPFLLQAAQYWLCNILCQNDCTEEIEEEPAKQKDFPQKKNDDHYPIYTKKIDLYERSTHDKY